MKKFLKRSMCVFLSVLMAATTLVAGTFSVSAATGTAAESLLSAIQGYESKMAENKIYTNMSAAYEAYVTACNWYDKYVLGTDSTSEATTVSTVASQLVTATNNMKEIAAVGDYNQKITYATGAADNSYTASDLASGGDSLEGAVYAYGVGSNSGYSSMTQKTNINSTSYNNAFLAGLQFGTVVLLYTEDEDGNANDISFPLDWYAKKNNTGGTLEPYFINIASGGSGTGDVGTTGSNVVTTMNDDAFALKSEWEGGTTGVGYKSTSSSYSISYYGTTTRTKDAWSSSGTSNHYYTNTAYYVKTPTENVETYGYFDYEMAVHEENNSTFSREFADFYFFSPAGTYSNGTGYYTLKGQGQTSTLTLSDEKAAYDSYVAYNKAVDTGNASVNNTSGDAAQAVYVINWQALLDAMNKYAGTTSPIVEIYNYREGSLSDYFKAIDELTKINPTMNNSSDPNGWVLNDYYIDASSTSAGVADKISKIKATMDTYIPQLKNAYEKAEKDTDVYDYVRDDSTYEYGWSTAVDENGQRIYGIADLQSEYEYGQYKRDENGVVTDEKVYDDESWEIFTEAYKLAQAVLRYGAENGYKDNYPYTSATYDGVLLDGVVVEGLEYDDTFLEVCTESSSLGCHDEDAYTIGETYYKLVYDADGDGILTVAEVCAALSRAYENLQYHFILDVVDADILYEVIKEAETLIQNSSYFTDQSFNDANLETLISIAKVAVWGSEDNYGIKAELLENSEENQKIVDDEVTTLVGIANGSGVEGLYIDWAKTVSSAGGYSLSTITAVCNALDESIYTASSWAVLQELLAEKDRYLGTGSEIYGNRNVTIDTTEATAVAGSAYQYIENYIALVKDIYYAYLSLEKSFTAIENGEIANVGKTVTATTYTTGNQKDYYWRLNMEYQQGMVFFRTNNEEYLFDLQNPQFSWQCKADYDALLDSISLDAQNDYAYFNAKTDSSGNTTYDHTLDDSNGHGTTHELNSDKAYSESNVTDYGLNETLRAQYPGDLSVATENGKFDLYNIYVTGQTANTDYIGYEPYLNNGARVPVMTFSYDWTGALSTTEGNDQKNNGGQGPIGGILSHSRSGNSWGETDFTATYTYTMPEYEKKELSASTRPTITTEDHEYGLGIITYQRTNVTIGRTYKEYWMGASAYNPQVSVVDITYLFDLIDLAESLRENDYTTASWNNFMEAYSAAVDYLAYTSMNATQIYNACCTRYDDLWDAYTKLVPVATLNIKDCEGNPIDLTTAQYSYTKDDENNQVTLTLDSLDWNWYVDDTAEYTITQAGTFNITIHTDCDVTTTTLPAQCSKDGYRDTSTHCNVCGTDVGYSHEVLEMTEEHQLSDWAYSVYATDEHAGLMERHCTNTWDAEAYGSDGCEWNDTKPVGVKVDPILEVDLVEVENTTDGGIYFSYPEGSQAEGTVGDDENLGNDKQYVIEFEYTGDADEVLNWDLYFTDETGGTYLEGRDYTIYYTSGGPYTDSGVDNSSQKYCTVSFRSSKAQEAWDEGTLIVNANTAIFKLGITAVDCRGNELTGVSYTVTNSSGENIAFTDGTYSGVADTYTVEVTNANGYVLDEEASVLETTIGDRDYEDLKLVFHTDVKPGDAVPTEPTCTEAGYTETVYTCQAEGCDYYYVETTPGDPALGHAYQVSADESQPATCTEDGYSRYICSSCGSYYDEILCATGHNWVETEDSKEPTCSEAGYTKYTCSNCGGEKTVTISATSHNYVVSETKDPSCEEEGYTEYKCSNCGETFRSTTPATGHMWRITETTPATCMAEGSVKYTCSVCGDTKTETIDIDPNAHSWVLDEENSVPATCTTDGKNVYICANGCGETMEETVSSDTAHNFYKEDGELNVKHTEPDCETAGSDVYTCTICGEEFSVEIPATGHDYDFENSFTIEATCETPAYEVYACKNCVDFDKFSASLDEDGNVVVEAEAKDGCTLHEPQYDSDGELIEGTGYYVYDVTAEATGHAYRYNEDESNPATCGTPGTEVYTCQNCGDSYTVAVEATGDHEWDEGEVTVEATCENEGEITYTCTECHTTKTEKIPKAHTWPEDDDTDHIKVTDATCVDGSIEYYCTTCGELITTEVIPATGHSYQTLVVDPLCEEKGYTVYYCEYCVNGDSIETAVDTSTNEFDESKVQAKTGYTLVEDSFYTDDTVAAHGHDYQLSEDPQKTYDATCTTPGQKTYTCTYDETHEWVYTIDALGHDWGDDVVTKEATCMQPGMASHTCKRCDEEEKSVEIPIDPDAHSWSEDPTQEATCTTDGYYECTNTDVNGVQCTEQKVIPATGHSLEFTVNVPATCETAGYDLYLCSSCVDADTVEQIKELAAQVEDSKDGIDAAKQLETLIGTLEDGQYSKENIDNAYGHTYMVTAEVAATCVAEGSKTYTCTICGDEQTEIIDKLSDNGEHTWDDGVALTKATCVEGGTTLYTCTVCGETNTVTTDPDTVNGHSYVASVTKEPTCTEEGTRTYHCSICDNKIYDYTEPIDMIDHDMVKGEVVAPTCLEDGYTIYKCSVCGTEEHRDIISAYGEHLWRVESVDEATCTEAGTTHYKCEYCDATDTDTIPATGHSWVDDEVITASTCTTPGKVNQVCQNCGDTRTAELAVDPDAHVWNDGVVTTEATCTTAGEITYTCKECGKTKVETIPATGHSYVDIVVAPTHDSDGYTIHICENCSSSGAVANLQSLAKELQGYVETSQSNAESTMEKIAAALAAEDEDCYYTDTDKSALGHDYGTSPSETKAATCDKAGYNRWVCSCGDYFDVEIPATGDHTWDAGTPSPAATHDSTGTMIYTCTECGATKSATIPKVGYSWGEWYTVKAATHLAEGEQRRDCNCGNSWCTSSETKSIAKLTQHTYKAVVTAPSCTSAGYTTYTCECGDQYIDNIIEALGHNWDSGKVTKPATCNATGTKTYTCKTCGATKEESIAKTSHSYTSTKTSATCTKQGYTTYTCKTCGYSYKSNYTDAKGHNYEFTKYSVKATRNKDGQKLYTCTCCGKTKTTSYAKIKSWKLDSTSATYSGKNITPKITIKDANGNTIPSKYYYYRIYCEKTQDVVGRINWVDKYYIEVVMKTKYSGEIMVGEFNVKPKSRSISSISKGSKSFTVKWKALKSSQITGYQIQYSTDKNFKNKKTITVKGSSKSSKKIKGLKGNKKYYVRIRTYKTRKDLKWYSSWSSVKGVTTKK